MVARSEKLPEVQTPELYGVTMRRSLMDLETGRMMQLVARVGRRLRFSLRDMDKAAKKDAQARGEYDPETGDWLDNHRIEPMPDEEWVKVAKWYTETMLGALKEQRLRALMSGKPGGVPLTEEEFKAELHELAVKALAEMGDAEFERLAKARRGEQVVEVIADEIARSGAYRRAGDSTVGYVGADVPSSVSTGGANPSLTHEFDDEEE